MRPRPARGIPAANALIVLLVCLLGWTLLYSPELLRAAKTNPDGLRRDVSLAVLSPIAWLADGTGLGAITDAAARAVGRDPDAQVGGVVGGVDVVVDDLPTIAPRPTRSGAPSNDPPPPPVRNTRLREPTGEKRLRVVVVGDSLAAGVGFYAERVFKPFFVEVVKQGRISTGLARPDYFNWPGQMQLIVDRYRPDLSIVMLGENDNQHLQAWNGDLVSAYGSETWEAEYERRVEQFARTATSRKGHVIWVGLPIVRDHARWPISQRLNRIYEDVADRLPNVAFVDTSDRFSKDGDYAAYHRDEGVVRLIRAADGIHFTPDGYTLLMEEVAKTARQEFRLDPRTYTT
jgi:hypothetical protein